MRPPPLLPDGADAELTRLLQEADNKAGYRRGLCLWLRAALGLSAAGVALALAGARVRSTICTPAIAERVPRHCGALGEVGTIAPG